MNDAIQWLRRSHTAFGSKFQHGQFKFYYLSGLKINCSFQIVPEDHAKSAIETVFEFNVKKFNNGETGAVNGMMPDGNIDTYTIQSEEMWSGVVYAYASLLLLYGMDEEAYATAGGLYKLVFERIGMGYQTPEALYEQGSYRAIAYMRPLSIWSMQVALDLRKEK